MADAAILDALPALYQRLLPELLQNAIPEESEATCAECAMCAKGPAPVASDRHFAPDVKCCSFHPTLPNYLVGGLLADAEPALAEGRRRVREKIARRLGVMPHGISPSGKRSVLQSSSRRAFGRSSALLCPYFDAREGGRCTVYAYREAVCSTWFCKFARGIDGRMFWTGLLQYLEQVERTLVLYTLHELGFVTERPQGSERGLELDAGDLEERAPAEAVYADRWREWAGREEQFYLRTFELVSQLTRADVERLAGIESTVLLAQVGRAHRRMTQPSPPERLKRNPRLMMEKESDGAFVLTDERNPLQPLRLELAAYELLDAYDGQRTNEEVAELTKQQKGHKLSPGLLARLYQFGILVDP